MKFQLTESSMKLKAKMLNSFGFANVYKTMIS